MTEPVTFEILEKRVPQLVCSYRAALTELGFDAETVKAWSASLQDQLKARRYHKGNSPRAIEHLVCAKRVTRYLIRCAIENRPAERARRDRLMREYVAKCKEIREKQPLAAFFSFEASYAGRLRVDVKPFAHLFRLTPKQRAAALS